MKIWLRSLLVGLAAAGITFGVLFLLEKKHNRGLYDAEFILAVAGDNHEGTKDEFISILSQRINKIFPGSVIRFTREQKFIVSMKKISDTVQAADLLTRQGRLQFCETQSARDVEAALVTYVQLFEKEMAAEKTAPPGQSAPAGDMSDQTRSLLDTLVTEEKKGETARGNPINFAAATPYGQLGTVLPADTARLRTFLSLPEVAGKLPGNTSFCFGYPTELSRDVTVLPLYAVKIREADDPMVLDNRSVLHAKQDYNFMNRPCVIFEFDNHGTRIWQKLTRENVGKSIAILVDDIVVTAPVVHEELTGSQAEIGADFKLKEAINLATLISIRPLPAPLRLDASIITPNNDSNYTRLLLFSLAALVIFTLGGWFIFKTLKTT